MEDIESFVPRAQIPDDATAFIFSCHNPTSDHPGPSTSFTPTPEMQIPYSPPREETFKDHFLALGDWVTKELVDEAFDTHCELGASYVDLKHNVKVGFKHMRSNFEDFMK